jgi:hypothetical protein
MLKTVWTRNRWAVLILAGACLVALFFAARLVVFSVYWSDPARRDAVIEGWQTPGYVAMSWKVPRPVIADALGLEEGERARVSLDEIAKERGVSTADLIRDLEAAIHDFRSDTP